MREPPFDFYPITPESEREAAWDRLMEQFRRLRQPPRRRYHDAYLVNRDFIPYISFQPGGLISE